MQSTRRPSRRRSRPHRRRASATRGPQDQHSPTISIHPPTKLHPQASARASLGVIEAKQKVAWESSGGPPKFLRRSGHAPNEPSEAMCWLRQQEHEDYNNCNDQRTDGDPQCKEFPSMLGLPQSGISDKRGDEASADRDAEKTS